MQQCISNSFKKYIRTPKNPSKYHRIIYYTYNILLVREVKQGDIISPKFFTLAFKRLD